MGYKLSRDVKSRIIELARQAEAAGHIVNKTRIAQIANCDRGVIIREIAKWEAAGKPQEWPPPDAPAIAQPPPIRDLFQGQQNQPLAAQDTSKSVISGPEPPDVYAAFLEFAKQHGLPIGAHIPQPPPVIERPTAPAIFTPTKQSKIAFVSDVHIPYENKVAVRLMLDFLGDYQPDLVILGGDIFDMYMVSDYERSPDRQKTMQDEFDEGRYFLNAIDELARGNVVFMEGNHEARVTRTISKNPGLFKLRSLDLPRAMELPSSWQYFPSQTHYRLGPMLALHGDVRGISERTAHPARTMFQRLKRSCIAGHHHRFGAHYDTDYDGTMRGGFANGHLSDLNQVRYVKNPDWQEGFSTIQLSADARVFAVQQRLIVNGRLIVEGKEYTL